MNDADTQLQMVADCEARESALTDWEANFIDHLTRLNRPLTHNEDAKLEEIWDRVTTARPRR